MRLFFLAGEVSGDHHAAKVITEILKVNSSAQIEGFGGKEMEKAGANIIRDLSHLAYMGFYEVVSHLQTIRTNFKIAKKRIKECKPNVLVLVDYPGFNLRMAQWAKKEGITVCYFIAPQVWAWKEGRLETLKKNVDLLIPILPFEESYFGDSGINVSYYGHPLVERINEYKQENSSSKPQKNRIGLFPGSRKQEITKILPIMLSVADKFVEYEFIIGATTHLSPEIYRAASSYKNVKIEYDNTYQVLSTCSLALTTSGTITLETALFGVPQVVCYKTSQASYLLGKRFIQVPYISLVNLILDRPLVSELIQGDLTNDRLSSEVSLLMTEDHAHKISMGYDELGTMLSGDQTVHRIATAIIELT